MKVEMEAKRAFWALLGLTFVIWEGSEHLVGLDPIVSNDTLPLDSESIFDDYFVWIVLGSALIVIVPCIVIIVRKIKK